MKLYKKEIEIHNSKKPEEDQFKLGENDGTFIMPYNKWLDVYS